MADLTKDIEEEYLSPELSKLYPNFLNLKLIFEDLFYIF